MSFFNKLPNCYLIQNHEYDNKKIILPLGIEPR